MNLSFCVFAPVIILGMTLAAPRCYSSTPLDSLKAQHPRLILHDADLPALRQLALTDPIAKEQYQQLLTIGQQLLSKPPDTYEIAGPEHTLLSTSRDVEGRVITLAGLYRISGYKPFAMRATQEMLAAASFPDWNPTHFLDTAEMTAALGIGYDWLYPTLSSRDRATIKKAIITKGIDPWLTLIHEGKAHHENNWCQVLNGGETIGALAVAEDEPQRANEVLDYARPAISEIMKRFAPDGGFEEGPGYWAYATIYNVLYIDALDSTLGTDFGASNAPGFSATESYHIQAAGPTDQTANFGDAESKNPIAPQAFWFAARFQNPIYAEQERESYHRNVLGIEVQNENSRFAFLGLVWLSRIPLVDHATMPPLVQSFGRVNQAYLRSAWNNPDAWFIGFKGGDAMASHGHLDLGTFVLDAIGQRWAVDLGPDSYGLPQYFWKKRWDYYRTRTEGHNTLTMDGQNEDLDAVSPLIATATSQGVEYSIANLDHAYKAKLKSWRRGIALLDQKRVLVQDEIAPVGSVNVVWNFHTAAKVKIAPDGHSAELLQHGKTIKVSIIEPNSAHFQTASTKPPAPQMNNVGITNLVIRLDDQSASDTIAVLFALPDDDVIPTIKTLSEWP